jgi:hypothetical protein
VENTIRARLDEIEAHIKDHTETCANTASAKLADVENRNLAQWDQSKADVLSEIDYTKKLLKSLFRGLSNKLQNDIGNHDTHTRNLEQNLKTILDSQQSLVKANLQLKDVTQDIKYLCSSLVTANPARNLLQSLARSSDEAQKRAVLFSSRKRQQMKLLPELSTDIIKGSALTISCVLYGHPSIKGAARALVSQILCDPILALLAMFAGYFFTSHFSNVSIPPSIGGQHMLRFSDPFVTWPKTDL